MINDISNSGILFWATLYIRPNQWTTRVRYSAKKWEKTVQQLKRKIDPNQVIYQVIYLQRHVEMFMQSCDKVRRHRIFFSKFETLWFMPPACSKACDRETSTQHYNIITLFSRMRPFRISGDTVAYVPETGSWVRPGRFWYSRWSACVASFGIQRHRWTKPI